MRKRSVIILSAAIALLLFIVFKVIKNFTAQEANPVTAIQAANAPAVSYTSESGLSHVRKQAVEADKDLMYAIYKEKIDSLAKELKISKNQIEAFASFEGKGSGLVRRVMDTVYIDSTRVPVYTLEDEWLTVRDTLNTDTGQAYVEQRDKVNLVFYRKDKILYADAWSTNPRMKYTNAQAAKVPEKKPVRIGFSVTVGPYNLTDFHIKQPRLFIVPGLSYRIF